MKSEKMVILGKKKKHFASPDVKPSPVGTKIKKG
jgi:hypothetical protein